MERPVHMIDVYALSRFARHLLTRLNSEHKFEQAGVRLISPTEAFGNRTHLPARSAYRIATGCAREIRCGGCAAASGPLSGQAGESRSGTRMRRLLEMIDEGLMSPKDPAFAERPDQHRRNAAQRNATSAV